MNSFKSMVFFIIFLFLVLPLLQGCTALNYHMGKDLDESYPGKKSHVKDYKLLEQGDLVEIKLMDRSRIRGQFISMEANRQIVIRDVGIDQTRIFDHETIKIENVEEVILLKYGIKNRVIWTSVGFFFDSFLIATYIVLKALASATSSMGV